MMKTYKPTRFMIQVLTWISEGKGSHWNCHGQSEHGGRQSAIFALMRHGYLDHELNVTEAGMELVKKGK